MQELGQALYERSLQVSAMIPKAVKALHFTAGLDHSDLQSRIKKAGNRWTGAIPTEETLNLTFPPPKAPQSLHVIGADGSQIYPDRHAAAFYYLINIGSIVVSHGSGKAPTIQQESRLFFELEDLYDEANHPVQNAYVNLRRDVAEMKTLAERAESLAGEQTLAILDNSLLLWMALQTGGSTSRETDRYLQEYLKLLDRLRSSKTGLAGFIDRPRSVSVLALIHLAGLPDDQITQDTLRLTPFRGLTDRAIFTKLLPPGHRSALFISASPLNRDFRTAGHEVYFFYLNTDADGTVVRVEIPIWVAQDPELLNRVHAGILKDCQTTGGFPYTLVRAHELAVISAQERTAETTQVITGGLMPESPMMIGRVTRCSTRGFVGAMQISENTLPVFGSLCRAEAQGGRSYVVGLVYDISITDDQFARQLAALDEVPQEQIADGQINRQVPVEFSALAVGFHDDDGFHQSLPPQPPLTLASVFSMVPRDGVDFTSELHFLQMILNAPQLPVDELLATTLRLSAQARPEDERERFLLQAGREVARLLAQDLTRLENILRGLRVKE
jgi:hypothetical protein